MSWENRRSRATIEKPGTKRETKQGTKQGEQEKGNGTSQGQALMFWNNRHARNGNGVKDIMMKIKELCLDERPREKMMAKGAEALSNAELLAIMLRTGTGKKNVIDVAREVLRSGGGKLNGIASMPIGRLCEISGVGVSKAVTVAAAFELGRRCAAESIIGPRTPVSSPKTVFRMMLPVLRNLDHEECWIIYLNRANYMIAKERISMGGLDSTTLDTRVIIRKAIEQKASGIIVVHNHPSGSALPGTADIQATRQLDKALKTCDISLLDHVVIAEDSYYSFADEELVKG